MEMDKLIDSPGLMTLSIRYNKKKGGRPLGPLSPSQPLLLQPTTREIHNVLLSYMKWSASSALKMEINIRRDVSFPLLIAQPKSFPPAALYIPHYIYYWNKLSFIDRKPLLFSVFFPFFYWQPVGAACSLL